MTLKTREQPFRPPTPTSHRAPAPPCACASTLRPLVRFFRHFSSAESSPLLPCGSFKKKLTAVLAHAARFFGWPCMAVAFASYTLQSSASSLYSAIGFIISTFTLIPPPLRLGRRRRMAREMRREALPRDKRRGLSRRSTVIMLDGRARSPVGTCPERSLLLRNK